MTHVGDYRIPLLLKPNGHDFDRRHTSVDCRERGHVDGGCNAEDSEVVLDITCGEDIDSSLDNHLYVDDSNNGTFSYTQGTDEKEICETSGATEDSYTRRLPHEELHPLYHFLGQQPALGPMPTIDPFRNHTEDIGSLYEWIKVVAFLPLAAIRLIIILLITVFGLLLAKLILLGWKENHLPMPQWRRGLLYITRLLGRLVLCCLGYHWIRRLGRPANRKVAPIIVSNHVSFIDPIFFFYEFFPSFVSSASHSDLPGIGLIIKCMQVINVDRSSAESKKHALQEIKARAMCNSFPHVMLFPEGTTTNGKVLIFFQVGAYMPGLPVQPVVLRYPFVHFDNSWGKISILKLLLRMLTQFHNFMEVEYLPVAFPSSMDKSHPALFAKKVKNMMARTLNVAESNHSYGDLVLLMKASEQNLLPASSYMVEMATMEKLFHVSTTEAMEFLVKFGAMDSCHSGYVTEDEFLESLCLPKTTFSHQIFSFFDKEERGSITFQEFLAGSAFILKHPSFGKLMRTGFDYCDLHKRGFLSFSEVERAFQMAFPDMNAVQMQRMVNKLDINGDGIISWDDFQNFLGQSPEMLCIFLPPGPA